MIEAGCPELAIDSDKKETLIREKADHTTAFIVAMAKSEVLHDFGDTWGAKRILDAKTMGAPRIPAPNALIHAGVPGWTMSSFEFIALWPIARRWLP